MIREASLLGLASYIMGQSDLRHRLTNPPTSYAVGSGETKTPSSERDAQYGVGSSNIAHRQSKKSQCSCNHILPSTTYDYNVAL